MKVMIEAMKGTIAMKRIPIKAAREVAEKYGYDQVMVYARKVGEDPDPHGEHMTTYGVDRKHCDAMALIAGFLQAKIMAWSTPVASRDLRELEGRCVTSIEGQDWTDEPLTEREKGVIKMAVAWTFYELGGKI